MTVILLLLACTYIMYAQRKEATVAVAVEQLRKAMVDADSVMLDKLTAADLSYGHSSGHLDDKTLFPFGWTADNEDGSIQLVDNSAGQFGEVFARPVLRRTERPARIEADHAPQT